ncbi:MAG: glycosyltransferase [Rhodoferax sp.]|nr:glycosyltransferase [Rhodoferax sp.]
MESQQPPPTPAPGIGQGSRPPALTVVTTCKGRLAHLQQTLPRLAEQDTLAVVVVDYGCPDQAGAWVRQHYPQVQVVQVADSSEFNIARARNLGAAQAQSPWLAFVDADILVGDTFAREVAALPVDRSFFTADPCPHELAGFVVCRRDDFLQVGGYDEVFTGWGTEDKDFYARLERLGLQRNRFPAAAMHPLPHADADRTRFHAIADRFLSLRINGMYFQIKHDLARLSGLADLPEQDRRVLYAKVRAQVLDKPGETCLIDAALPARCDFVQPPGWRLRRTIRYRFEPTDHHTP